MFLWCVLVKCVLAFGNRACCFRQGDFLELANPNCCEAYGLGLASGSGFGLDMETIVICHQEGMQGLNS